MRYWLLQDNQVRGPYSAAELTTLSGFSAETQVCPESGEKSARIEWKPAGSLSELALTLEVTSGFSMIETSFGGLGKSLEIPSEPTIKDLVERLQRGDTREVERVKKDLMNLERAYGEILDLKRFREDDAREIEGLKEEGEKTAETARAESEQLKGLREDDARTMEKLREEGTKSAETARGEIEDLKRLREDDAGMMEKLREEGTKSAATARDEIEDLKRLRDEDVREAGRLTEAHDKKLGLMEVEISELKRFREDDNKKLEMMDAERVRLKGLLEDDAREQGRIKDDHLMNLKKAKDVVSKLERLRDDDASELGRIKEELKNTSEAQSGVLELMRLREVDAREMAAIKEALQDLQKEKDAPRTPASLPAVAAPPASVEGKSSTGGWRSILAVVAGAMLLGGLGWMVQTGQDSGGDYLLPTSHPSALVWNEDSIWIADWYDSMIYRATIDSRGLRTVKRYSLPNTHPMGMAVVGRHVYIADGWSGRIERRVMDDDLTVDAQWNSPGPNPSALFYDGTHLWSADRETQRIYQHALDGDLTVLRTFEMGIRIVGIYGEGESLWVVDGDKGRFHRIDPKSGRVLAVSELPELRKGYAPVSSVAWKDDRLWVGRDGSSLLIERPHRLLR